MRRQSESIRRLATRMGWERQFLWVGSHFRGLALASLVGLIGGVGLSLVVPQQFEVDLVLQPSSGDTPQLSGNLASIASKFGVRPSVENSSLDFFALVLQSDTVLRTLLRRRLPSSSGTVGDAAGVAFATYYDVSDQADEEAIAKTVKRLRKDLSVNSDIPSGTVGVSLKLTEPTLALEAARALVAVANHYLEELNSETHRAERVFLEDQVTKAQAALNSQEDALQRFYEQNRNFNQSSQLRVLEGRLLRRVQIAQDQYVSLSDQLGSARLAEARNTPVLTMVDPGVLPPPPTLLRKIAIGVLIGFAATLFWVGWELLRTMLQEPSSDTELPRHSGS